MWFCKHVGTWTGLVFLISQTLETFQMKESVQDRWSLVRAVPSSSKDMSQTASPAPNPTPFFNHSNFKVWNKLIWN